MHYPESPKVTIWCSRFSHWTRCVLSKSFSMVLIPTMISLQWVSMTSLINKWSKALWSSNDDIQMASKILSKYSLNKSNIHMIIQVSDELDQLRDKCQSNIGKFGVASHCHSHSHSQGQSYKNL